MKSGFVSIIGRPNVGKSTLLNAFLGQKIVITSPKPQTTRNRILGILTETEEEGRGVPCQIVFQDTPGVHKPKDGMNRFMMAEVGQALKDVDVILMLIDISEGVGKGDQYIFDWIREHSAVKVLALNKIDRVEDKTVLEAIASIAEKETFSSIHPISALHSTGVAELQAAIKAALPEGPLYYEDDIVTDRPERFIVGEIIRERIFDYFQEEIPYSAAVIVEEMKEREQGKQYIRASILVERDTQKAVLIGKGGSAIKEVGRQSREEIQQALGYDCYLELFVKVRRNWRKDGTMLKELGYT